MLVRKDMDKNEFEKLSNVKLRNKLKERNSVFITVLYIYVHVLQSTLQLANCGLDF